MIDHAFSPEERRTVCRVIAERRDMRRFVPGADLLVVAHARFRT